MDPNNNGNESLDFNLDFVSLKDIATKLKPLLSNFNEQWGNDIRFLNMFKSNYLSQNLA